MNIKLIGGYMDTRSNDEDFALTPYLSLFYSRVDKIKSFGLGITFGFWSIHIGLSINRPKGFTRFLIVNK